MSYKIVHYINQFFAGIGGEEKADYPPEMRDGPVGPGMALKAAFGTDAEIVGTVVCGDGYFAENMERAAEEVVKLIAEKDPDAVVAGPAFNAGRYGTACGAVAEAVQEKLGIPVVTGMYPENPGVDMYKKSAYIVPTEDSARGIKKAVPAMVKLVLKAIDGEVGSPEEDGYIPRGIRVNLVHEKNGAERAVEMLLKKLNDEPFKTEYPMPSFDRVAPAPPVKDMANATIAVVTSGGIVPKDNPDRIEASSATHYGTYDISDTDSADAENYETAHGGYDPTYANSDPNRVLPVDVLREMEKEGRFGKLYDRFSTTVGNGTPVANAKRFGEEIGANLVADGVDAVILTST
jgi:betaine reductase